MGFATDNVCGNDGEWYEVPPFLKSDHCFDSLQFAPSPMGSSICGNDGKWYEGFLFFVGEAHVTTFCRTGRGVLGGFDCFCPLPNPLPRGEGID